VCCKPFGLLVIFYYSQPGVVKCFDRFDVTV